MGWFSLTMIASILLVPAWMSISFFWKAFGVTTNGFLVWFFVGVLTTIVWNAGASAALPWRVAAAIAVIGAVCGGFANILLFKAIFSAPNPALPLALGNVAHIGTYFCAIVLTAYVPRYFESAELSWSAVLGICLMSVGASILALSR